jgi:hypothetical protein
MGDRNFTTNDARSIGEQLGIDCTSSPFDVEQFRAGMDVELEHGTRDPDTDVTGDDPLLTGKIALAHLRESLADASLDPPLRRGCTCSLVRMLLLF